MVYPKRKVLRAASGMNTADIESVDNAIISGVGMIPGYGQVAAAALKIGSKLGTAISGDGTNGAKGALGDAINPFSTINALASGRATEAIPIVGSFIKAKRLQKERSDKQLKEQNIGIKKLNDEGSQMFGQLTYAKGGSILGQPKDGSQKNAVILGGKRHKDGGNDIVDTETGEKTAETESGELLFTRDQTSEIEGYISKYNESNDQECLLNLGTMVKGIVSKNMIDYSKEK